MVEVDFKITGFDKALNRLATFPGDIRGKGLRFAMRKAANLVRDSAKINALKIDDAATGQSIADNIAVRFSSRQSKRTGDVVFRVGVLKGAKLDDADPSKPPGAPTPHWRLIELGTFYQPARPFMQPALRDNSEAATAEAARQLNKWIDRNYGRNT